MKETATLDKITRVYIFKPGGSQRRNHTSLNNDRVTFFSLNTRISHRNQKEAVVFDIGYMCVTLNKGKETAF